ncbi:ATP-binding cassette domain-containing protein, partial [Microbacterium sp. CPCC 204701]|uniref:ATP-binding cassette domain-containing protein n=1 Tax=Microbacterium sp. CPCC 204701 TaxID=2493084 RepID=UPI0013E39E9C
SGSTGSGKSTFLRAIAGLHEHVDGGWTAGSLRVVGHDRAAVPPRDLAQRVGVVLQHPRDAFATARVRDEIGLALELRGVAPVSVAARVTEIASRVGIGGLLDRPTRGISAGEATLVAIAAAIVEHPILLLVDEPLADLDADARVRVARLLDLLAHDAGMCVVVAEHRVATLAPLADRRLRIDDGLVVEVPAGAEVDRSEVESQGISSSLPPHDAPDAELGAASPTAAGLRVRSGDPVLTGCDVTVRYGGVVAVASVTLELFAGEVVALAGPNGAGKSSLLAALALPTRDSRVEAAGRVALVPDASDDLFAYDTVAAECRRADRRATSARRAHRPPSIEVLRRNEERSTRSGPHLGEFPHSRVPRPGATAARLAGFLGLDPAGPEFATRLARHPLDLSVGERRCLALALQLAGDPAVLLVDEPTRGLDPAARDLVWA